MKILITGASRGIGRAIALASAKTGRFHHMHLTCRKSLDKLEEIREEILGIDPELLVSIGQGDLQSVDDANIIAKEMGPVDVIINNAAVSYTGPLIDMTEDMWNDTISTNISSIPLAIRPCIIRRRPYIVIIKSIIPLIGIIIFFRPI